MLRDCSLKKSKIFDLGAIYIYINIYIYIYCNGNKLTILTVISTISRTALAGIAVSIRLAGSTILAWVTGTWIRSYSKHKQFFLVIFTDMIAILRYITACCLKHTVWRVLGKLKT